MINRTALAIGSFCYALSASLQHEAVGHQTDRRGSRPMGWSALWRAICSPRWLAGMSFLGVSLGCQVAALVLAPVSVVQPVGLLAFPWAIVLQAVRFRHRITPLVGVTTAATIAATLAFSVTAANGPSPAGDLEPWRVISGALVVYALTAVMAGLGVAGPQHWRCLLWASGGAMFYGLEAALVKSLLSWWSAGRAWHSVEFWGIIVALVLGSLAAGWMIQQGYATGPAQVVVGATTITSPIIAVAYGLIVLGEGRGLHLGQMVTMAICAALAVAGVVVLTRLGRCWFSGAEPRPAAQVR